MTQDLYTNLLLNACIGLVVGSYGALIGAGGGFLLVPIFLLLHKMPHTLAAGTSLMIVAANAMSGSIGYMRQGRVDYHAGLTFALATIPGAVGGALLVHRLSEAFFAKLFGGFLLLISLYLFIRRARRAELASDRHTYSQPVGLSISLVVGFVSSLFGIGGGILHVPAMTEILKFPVHIAVATSQFILAWTALIGAVIYALKGSVDLLTAFSTGIGAVVGAQIGVWIAPRLRGTVILRYLALALLAVGLRLIF